MTAQEHLSGYGVTIDVAKNFIMSNLSNLQNIFDVCKQFGVTNDMIAEIVDIDGVDGTGVANFFASNGIDSDSLGGASKTIEIVGNYDNSSSDKENDTNLNLGISIFVESQVSTDIGNDGSIEYTTYYTYSYENGLLNKFSDGYLQTQYIFDSNGNIIEERDIIDNAIGNITTYSYNSAGQIITASSDYFSQTNTWSDNSITSNGKFLEENISYTGLGTGLNPEKDAPLKWENYLNEELYSVDYYTYDANGNEILDLSDEDADGIIDYAYHTEWILLS